MRRLLSALFAAFLWAAPALAVDQSTVIGDVSYTGLNTDVRIITSAAFTAQRTITLPFAGGTFIGQGQGTGGGGAGASALEIIDVAGAIGSSNSLVIAPQSGDTINGSSSPVTVNVAKARIVLWPLSGTNWFMQVFTPGGQLLGTATNDNACAGCVGEVISASVAQGSAVALTTATPANITNVSLTAGDWDCRGAIQRVFTGTTSYTLLQGGISGTSATLPTGPMGLDVKANAATVPGQAIGPTSTMSLVRNLLAATTSVFLVVQDTFTASTDSAYGGIVCRRAR